MRPLIALCCALLFGCASAGTPGEVGFVPLFNGKDLSGWSHVNDGPDTWSVRDGKIVTTGHPNGVLRSDRMYENFVLELEWSHQKEGGNSGLFVHSGALPIRGNCFTKAFEIQIMLGDDPKGLWTRHGDIFSIQGASFVPDRPHPQGWQRCLPSEHRVKGAGEWNHYRVTSLNGSIKLEANGKEVSGGTQCNPRKGYICLESEGAECHFRNLRIKELPSSNPPDDQVAEADLGFHTLYGGDLRGWKILEEDDGHWKAKDWILDFDGKGRAGKLATESEYGDFAVILDWRCSVKGQSPALCLRGERLAGLKPSEKAGDWIRTIVLVEHGRYKILRGTEVEQEGSMATAPARGPLCILSASAVQFANVYIKELK